MSTQRSGIAIAIALTSSLAFGCSHEEPREETHARVQTSGAERRAEARADRVADRARDDGDDRDRDGDDAEVTVVEADAPTAMDQSESAEDLEITRQIRAAVIGDSSLSFSARNCTIITSDAVVTLRGDVSSNQERESIDRHAHEAPGVTRVDNMLVVSE